MLVRPFRLLSNALNMFAFNYLTCFPHWQTLNNSDGRTVNVGPTLWANLRKCALVLPHSHRYTHTHTHSHTWPWQENAIMERNKTISGNRFGKPLATVVQCEFESNCDGDSRSLKYRSPWSPESEDRSSQMTVRMSSGHVLAARKILITSMAARINN